MSVVTVATAFPIPQYRAEVIAAFEAAIKRVHDEPGVELYALLEGPDRLVMIEKYASEQARAVHRQGAALADLRSALEGKLSGALDARARPRGAVEPGLDLRFLFSELVRLEIELWNAVEDTLRADFGVTLPVSAAPTRTTGGPRSSR